MNEQEADAVLSEYLNSILPAPDVKVPDGCTGYAPFFLCPLSLALERYRQHYHREPDVIVCHPDQARTVSDKRVVAAAWCPSSPTPGLGPWYLRPSREEME